MTLAQTYEIMPGSGPTPLKLFTPSSSSVPLLTKVLVFVNLLITFFSVTVPHNGLFRALACSPRALFHPSLYHTILYSYLIDCSLLSALPAALLTVFTLSRYERKMGSFGLYCWVFVFQVVLNLTFCGLELLVGPTLSFLEGGPASGLWGLAIGTLMQDFRAQQSVSKHQMVLIYGKLSVPVSVICVLASASCFLLRGGRGHMDCLAAVLVGYFFPREMSELSVGRCQLWEHRLYWVLKALEPCGCIISLHYRLPMAATDYVFKSSEGSPSFVISRPLFTLEENERKESMDSFALYLY